MFCPFHSVWTSLRAAVLSEGQTNVPKSPLVVSDFGPIEEERTMGMDVYGREPSDEQGNYFRASVWSWLPLHEAMYRTCADVLDQELIEAMAFNGGDGPEDQETCNQIADRMEALLREKPGGIEVHATLRKTADGRLLSPEELAQLDPKVETQTPYRVTGEHMQEFIGFLRHCGGFAVC
ncbi:hypothetical protein [Bythopirellula goksoeyrii]|nr:hypothetical protein [Bythopirellula goksoeyrii]